MNQTSQSKKIIAVFFKDGSSHACKVKDTAHEALLVTSGDAAETIPWTMIEHVEFRKADSDATRNGFLVGALIVVGVAAILASGSSESYSWECTGWICD